MIVQYNAVCKKRPEKPFGDWETAENCVGKTAAVNWLASSKKERKFKTFKTFFWTNHVFYNPVSQFLCILCNVDELAFHAKFQATQQVPVSGEAENDEKHIVEESPRAKTTDTRPTALSLTHRPSKLFRLESPRLLDRGFFSWIFVTIKLSDAQYRERVGPDAVQYLTFQRYLIRFVYFIDTPF